MNNKSPAASRKDKRRAWFSRFIGVCFASIAALSVGSEIGGHHWEYEGDDGPEHWADLDPEFQACAGKNQSPIDLSHFIEAELPPIEFDYKVGGNEVINNGHTIQVAYDDGSSITLDSIVFELKQFHFHVPSENHINGRSFPMEAHFVHADSSGNLAVIALMFQQGARNPALDAVWKRIPNHAGDERALTPEIAATDLLPADRDYYRYSGSLTTPPCSEGVRWLVLKQPVTASAQQLRALITILGHPNNRPVQPVGARPVLQ